MSLLLLFLNALFVGGGKIIFCVWFEFFACIFTAVFTELMFWCAPQRSPRQPCQQEEEVKTRRAVDHSVAVGHHSARADNDHTAHGAVFCFPVDEV